MLRPIVVLALSFLHDAMIMGQVALPERKVAGNVVTSECDPAVRIELPKGAQYAGADRWVLYGIADLQVSG